ncbi:uncharacterized protein LOC125032924 [Penaeus chinensis]|uniref:uncharacterized protein LOC125032924 n=1 Tax=Penaeus chinensis TaxID=139456 RepID=UPI001FB641A9|nr:uncharacterized protein LOC125032924 [Penaeus chinensis]
MVAPYEIGDPVRSFVRVPGSGSDKAAKSLCCDLARVSSAAAAVSVRPVTAATTRQSSAEGGDREQDAVVKKEEVQVKVEKDEVAADSQQSAAEQRREVKCKKRHAEDSEIMVHAKRSCVSGEETSEVSPDSSKGTNTSKGEERSAVHEKLEILEKHCIELKRQNHQLQQRLSLFCKLFKDPKKLAFALKRMETQAN